MNMHREIKTFQKATLKVAKTYAILSFHVLESNNASNTLGQQQNFGKYFSSSTAILGPTTDLCMFPHIPPPCTVELPLKMDDPTNLVLQTIQVIQSPPCAGFH